MPMLAIAADRRAVFTIERHIEHRPELGLQLEALAHPRFDARVVIADRNRRGRFAGVEQCLARVDHQSKGLTPSCSSCSSFSVRLTRSCLNAMFVRPST